MKASAIEATDETDPGWMSDDWGTVMISVFAVMSSDYIARLQQNGRNIYLTV